MPLKYTHEVTTTENLAKLFGQLYLKPTVEGGNHFIINEQGTWPEEKQEKFNQLLQWGLRTKEVRRYYLKDEKTGVCERIR
jgi:hypothetical protein